MSFSERILVHGPCLRDLTDFLYFDKIAYPVLLALLRPPGLAPGAVGYKAQELISQDIIDQLKGAGLIVTPAEVLLTSQPSDLPGLIEEGVDAATVWAQKATEILGSALFEICTLEAPLQESNISKWLYDIDRRSERLSGLMKERNNQAISKYYEEDVTRVLTPGWDSVLGITLPLPCLSHGVPIQRIIDFLADSQTVGQRAHVFGWHKEIVLTGENSSTLVEQITDLLLPRLQAYLKWLFASGLVSGLREAEFLISTGGHLNTSEVKSQNECFRLATRGLNLTSHGQTGSEELAYITSAKRNWRDWYHGILA